MGDSRGFFNICQHCPRIADGFNKHRLCVIADRGFHGSVFGRIDKGSGNAELPECMFQKVVCSAVDAAGSDNMISCLGEVLKHAGQSRRAGSGR